MTYLDGAHVRVLRHVLVLIESIFGQLALAQIDAELDEQEHNGLQGGDGTIAGSLGGDMFVEQRQRRLRLADGDELLCSL